ncbi:MAG: 50S ribosomal protein L13 [Candidatus Ryanbacteria bacterium]|nr:50S ribosomal protein L13 [Candidatus Ryanbacteria bacterium]
MANAKHNSVTLDAAGKALGRVSSEAASLLRGKKSPAFERHEKPSQKVVIVNAARVRFSGKKLLQRSRERYSGYPGGLKLVPYKVEFNKNPAKFLERAIAGMLPRNRLRKSMLKNLTIYVSDKK